MSARSGSARPRRGRAAPAALRYPRGSRNGPAGPKKREWGGCLFVPLLMLAFLALLVPLALADMRWGDRVWGDLAPAWPGGAYAFAGTVGAVVPLGLAALIAPLSRMNWKAGKVRSLGWATAALPGLALCWLLAGVILRTTRPKHRRDWTGDCYDRGGPCWVHQEYPWLWAVGLAGTLVMGALVVVALVRITERRDAAAK